MSLYFWRTSQSFLSAVEWHMAALKGEEFHVMYLLCTSSIVAHSMPKGNSSATCSVVQVASLARQVRRARW